MNLKEEWRYLYEWLMPKSKSSYGTVRTRLAIAYAFFGWNSALYGFYLMCYKDKPSRKEQISKQIAKGEYCHVLQMDGLSVIKNTVEKKDMDSALLNS